MSQLNAETQQRHFITRSSYEGAWDRLVNVMDGFGSYRYPDGSEYRGRFHQGQFHGYGHLRLAQPYRFTVKGEFEHGRLVTVEDMWFSDGLHVDGRFNGMVLQCDEWDYLTPKDRRYHAERRYGQQPVGPTAFLTSKMQPRNIPEHCYDVEEGLFNSKTCWLTDRPSPLHQFMYVSCPQDKDWIKKNCRKARTSRIIEPPSDFCRRIIAALHVIERHCISAGPADKDVPGHGAGGAQFAAGGLGSYGTAVPTNNRILAKWPGRGGDIIYAN